MCLKNSLEQVVLESSRDVRKLKNTEIPKNDWNSYFQIDGEFIVEIGKIKSYSAFMKVCTINEFYDANFHPNTASIEVEKELLEDFYIFKSELGGVSKEVRKYTFELLGRTFSLLNSRS